jgi:hypothetical protein
MARGKIPIIESFKAVDLNEVVVIDILVDVCLKLAMKLIDFGKLFIFISNYILWSFYQSVQRKVYAFK